MQSVDMWANGSQQVQEMPNGSMPQQAMYVPQQQPPAQQATQLQQPVYPQRAYGHQVQQSPVDIEKVKIWIQFGGLMVAFLLIGFMAGSAYTRANLAFELQSYGTVEQR